MARIRHLAILTEDVDRLVKFYTNSFGLKIVHGVGTATYLTDGHINLALIPIGPEREIEGDQLKEGINHFGFEVESVEALVPVCRQWGAATDVKKRPPNREAESRVWESAGSKNVYRTGPEGALTLSDWYQCAGSMVMSSERCPVVIPARA